VERCAIEFCVRLGKSESETLQLIHEAYRDDAMRTWKGSSELEVIKRLKPPVPLSSWNLRQTVCSTFLRSGWCVVRSATLAKGSTSKKRPSPHLHKVPTRSNKASPRIFQTALVYWTTWHWDMLSHRVLQTFPPKSSFHQDIWSVRLGETSRTVLTTASFIGASPQIWYLVGIRGKTGNFTMKGKVVPVL
jgi:hypothetical protein